MPGLAVAHLPWYGHSDRLPRPALFAQFHGLGGAGYWHTERTCRLSSAVVVLCSPYRRPERDLVVASGERRAAAAGPALTRRFAPDQFNFAFLMNQDAQGEAPPVTNNAVCPSMRWPSWLERSGAELCSGH
jgi:hypothetical protein